MGIASLKGLNLKQLLDLYERRKKEGYSSYELRGHRRYIKYVQSKGKNKRFYLIIAWLLLGLWLVAVLFANAIFKNTMYILLPLWFLSMYLSFRYRIWFGRGLLDINVDKYQRAGLTQSGQNWFQKIEKWNKESD